MRGAGLSDDLLAMLRCPICEASFERTDAALRCANGHSFDLARQGYVNLRRGDRATLNADTSAMVAARERVHGAGHFDRIAQRLASLVAEHAPAVPGLVLDLAGGTGTYLAAVLDRMPRHPGLCIELSTPALKRAAVAHERAAAIGSDLRHRLPLADDSAAVVMSVFGPRNIAEIARVLAPGGLFAVVTPTPAHLAELIEPLGMVRVDAAKPERLAAALEAFTPVADESVEYTVPMDHATLEALVGMGPSAHHVTPGEIAARVASLPTSVIVTLSVRISVVRA